MDWQEPVTQRTAQDVAERNERGVFTAADMMRMEQNNACLMDIFGGEHTVRRWVDGDFIHTADMVRMAEYLERAKAAFYAYTEGFMPPCVPGPPELPFSSYTQFNTLEDIQYQLHRIWRQNGAEKYRADSEAYAGERIGVL